MHLAVYIGLNCLYFIFGVILVNAIRKEFFSQAQKKIFQPDSQKEIFIPTEREKSNYYLNELLKKKNKPRMIFILPQADLLLKPQNFWNILSIKYIHQVEYLFNFLTPCYAPDSYQDRRRLELDIQKGKKYPMFFILRGSKNDNSIFKVNDKNGYLELQSEYREKNYQLIQRIDSNIFAYQNKIFVLESYMLWIKNPLENGGTFHKIELFRFKNIRYMLLDMISGNLVNCQKLETLLQTDFFKKPHLHIIENIDKNYKFIKENFVPIFREKLEGLNSTCFEIFSIKFILNSAFDTYIYRIDRQIDIFDTRETHLFSSMVNEVYQYLKLKKELNTELLIPIC